MLPLAFKRYRRMVAAGAVEGDALHEGQDNSPLMSAKPLLHQHGLEGLVHPAEIVVIDMPFAHVAVIAEDLEVGLF